MLQYGRVYLIKMCHPLPLACLKTDTTHFLHERDINFNWKTDLTETGNRSESHKTMMLTSISLLIHKSYNIKIQI